MPIKGFAATAVLLPALLLAACSAVTAAPRPDLVIAMPQGLESGYLAAAVSAYERETGLAIQVDSLPADLYGKTVDAVLLAGLNQYDLVYLPAVTLPEWAAYHAILPLGEVSDPAVAPWLGPLTLEGSLYALPAQVSTEVLWYRSDLLEQAGLTVPNSWSELEAAVRVLNSPPDHSGFAIAGLKEEAGTEFAVLLASLGGQPGFERPEDRQMTVRALELFAGLYHAGLTLPDTLKTSRGQVQSALLEGRAAFGIAPLEAAARLQNCRVEPAPCSDGVPMLQWTWLPGLSETQSVGQLQVWAVPVRAAHPEAGWAFARWMVSEAGARAWAEVGGYPPNRRVLKDLGPVGQAFARIESHRLPLAGAVAHQRIRQAVDSAVFSVLNGELSPAQALETASLEIQVARNQDGY